MKQIVTAYKASVTVLGDHELSLLNNVPNYEVQSALYNLMKIMRRSRTSIYGRRAVFLAAQCCMLESLCISVMRRFRKKRVEIQYNA